MVAESELRCHRVNPVGVRVVPLCDEVGGEAITTIGTVGEGAVALGEDQGMLDVPLLGIVLYI